MGVIGEEIGNSIVQQVNARQKLQGSGVKKLRTSNQIKVLNSTNSFLKVASGVSLSKEKAQEIGFSSSSEGTRIPKNYILFNGTSTYTGKQKQSFVDGSYEKSDFGLIPMAGVQKFNVKNLNRGSLKKATLNFTVHSKEQFAIVDVLYLRLGYTVLIEWGNSAYTTTGKDYITQSNTLLESDFFSNNVNYSSIQTLISEKRSQTGGNYDALIGKISNFDWSFKPDGSYDINITVISIGDVIESLKVNLAPSNSLIKCQDFLDARDSTIVVEGRELSQIHSMLWTFKYLNRATQNGGELIQRWKGSSDYIGRTLTTGEDTLSIYKYIYNVTIGGVYRTDWKGAKYYDFTFSTKYRYEFSQDEHSTGAADKIIKEFRWRFLYYGPNKESRGTYVSGFNSSMSARWNDTWAYVREWTDENWSSLYQSTKWFTEKVGNDIPNPISEIFNNKDAFKTNHPTPLYYLRFGALLNYLSKEIIPVYKNSGAEDSAPLIGIDSSTENSFFFTMPNVMSLDVKKCWVNSTYTNPVSFGDKVKGYDQTQTSPQLYPVRSIDVEPPENSNQPAIKNSHINKGLTMNIYLNFDYITEVLNQNTDEEGNVSIYKFIEGLCTGLNESLGGVNKLEPSIDENTNLLRIIDTTPIPGEIPLTSNPSYKLNLFGYNNSQTQSTFVRKLNIKTAITKEFATMVTVGATAGGYTKGVEATAFSKWNKGIVDRFKEEISSPSQTVNEAKENKFPDEIQTYLEKYLKDSNQSIFCHSSEDNTTSGTIWNSPIDDDKIASNLNIVKSFNSFAIARYSQLQGGETPSTVGFIPFKMSLTMDGLSGIKIYNVLRIDSSFLPKSYGNSLEFIVTAVNHNITNNDWETQIELTVMPKVGNIETGVIKNYDYLFDEEVINNYLSKNATVSGTKTSSKSTPPTNNSPSTVVRDPKGAKGTIGTMGIKPKSELAPKALDKAGIDAIVSNSGTTDELRKRIVTILASYVGNNEVLSSLQNQGWHDIKMEDKLKKPHVTEKGWGWYQPQPWCAWFVSRVMYEAHVAGNALVSPASDKYKSIWKDKYNDGAKNSPFSAGVSTTLNYFRDKLSRHITSSQAKKDPSLVQPGDIAYWASASHIGIVVKVNTAGGKLTSVDIISGNTGEADVRDGGRTDKATVRIGKLKGFSQIFTS